MAYREDISRQQLFDVRTLLAKISCPEYKDMVPGDSFNVAHNCLQLLDEARRLFADENPKYSQWRVWGPGYYHIALGSTDDVTHHALGFDIYPGRWIERRLCARLFFPISEKKPVHWLVRYYRKEPPFDEEQTVGIRSISTGGNLDVHKMVASLAAAARRWKVA